MNYSLLIYPAYKYGTWLHTITLHWVPKYTATLMKFVEYLLQWARNCEHFIWHTAASAASIHAKNCRIFDSLSSTWKWDGSVNVAVDIAGIPVRHAVHGSPRHVSWSITFVTANPANRTCAGLLNNSHWQGHIVSPGQVIMTRALNMLPRVSLWITLHAQCHLYSNANSPQSSIHNVNWWILRIKRDFRGQLPVESICIVSVLHWARLHVCTPVHAEQGSEARDSTLSASARSVHHQRSSQTICWCWCWCAVDKLSLLAPHYCFTWHGSVCAAMEALCGDRPRLLANHAVMVLSALDDLLTDW